MGNRSATYQKKVIEEAYGLQQPAMQSFYRDSETVLFGTGAGLIGEE